VSCTRPACCKKSATYELSLAAHGQQPDSAIASSAGALGFTRLAVTSRHACMPLSLSEGFLRKASFHGVIG